MHVHGEDINVKALIDALTVPTLFVKSRPGTEEMYREYIRGRNGSAKGMYYHGAAKVMIERKGEEPIRINMDKVNKTDGPMKVRRDRETHKPYKLTIICVLPDSSQHDLVARLQKNLQEFVSPK